MSGSGGGLNLVLLLSYVAAGSAVGLHPEATTGTLEAPSIHPTLSRGGRIFSNSTSAAVVPKRVPSEPVLVR
jgi:hypothetical protein